jgi:hypothetical protein
MGVILNHCTAEVGSYDVIDGSSVVTHLKDFNHFYFAPRFGQGR